MKEILTDIERWISTNTPIAIATVLQTWGSSPRRVGAKMAVTPKGQICGSVSGGCVEAAVIETALDVLKSGKPQLLHFGVTNDTAWDVGLACGGSIDIFVKPFNSAQLESIKTAIEANCGLAIVTVIHGPDEDLGREMLIHGDGNIIGTLGESLGAVVIPQAREAILSGQSRRVMRARSLEVFIDVIAPSPEIVIIGGVHIAIALVKLAAVLDYRVTIIDPREVFSSDERFPNVHRLFRAWPTEALSQIVLSPLSAVVVLTHDPKIDDPALRSALQSPAFYVGALGSPTTQQQRCERLLASGIPEDLLAKLHSPVGLHLGGHTPEEIALSILSEIVMVRNQH